MMGTQPAPAPNCWARRRTRRVADLAASLAKEGSLSDARGEGGARGAGGCVARVSMEGVQAQAEPRTRRVRVCSLATDSFLSLGCGRGSAAVSCSEAAPRRPPAEAAASGAPAVSCRRRRLRKSDATRPSSDSAPEGVASAAQAVERSRRLLAAERARGGGAGQSAAAMPAGSGSSSQQRRNSVGLCRYYYTALPCRR